MIIWQGYIQKQHLTYTVGKKRAKKCHLSICIAQKVSLYYISSLSDRERIPLMNSTVQIVKAGKLPAKHKLNIPFNMVFEKSSEFENELLETYHGVNISIEYYMRGRVKRGLLSMQNILTQQMEIYASSRPIQGTVSTKAREFIMTPESVEISNVENNNTLMQPSQLPGNIEFQIKGHLDSVAFSLDDPLTGSSK